MTNKLKKLVLTLSIYFSIILLVIIIAKFDIIFSAIKSFITIMSPIIIGFFLAYILNPIRIKDCSGLRKPIAKANFSR